MVYKTGDRWSNSVRPYLLLSKSVNVRKMEEVSMYLSTIFFLAELMIHELTYFRTLFGS